MAKKLCALFLFCCMAIGFSVPCAAATDPYELFKITPITESKLKPMEDSLDLMQNGSFEYMADETKPSKWGLSAPNDQSFLGSENFHLNDTRLTDVPEESKIVKSGYRALRITNKEKALTLINCQEQIKRSANMTEYECEFGASFYMLSDKAAVSIEALVTVQDEEGNNKIERFSIGFTDIMKKGEWVTQMVSLTLPISASRVELQPRLSSEGDVIMDDVFFIQKCDQVYIDEKKPREKLPPVPGTPANMLGLKYPGGVGNGDFETTQEGDTPWLLQHLDTPADIRFSTNENHTQGGKQSLLLQNITNIRGRAYQNLYDFVPGATYQVSWWYKVATEVQTSVSYEMRWFPCEKPWDEPDLGLASGDGWADWQDPEDNWKEFIHTFVAPYPPEEDDPLSAEICIRIGGKNASAYFDDVEICMVKEPDVAKIRSDEAIYYTEYPYGTVDAEVANYYAEKMAGSSMCYRILDGEKVIVEPQTVPFAEVDGKLKASGEFPTSVMQANKKGQTYSYIAEILDAAGNVLQTQQSAIYRFDRPHYLGVDGVFRKNGKEYQVGTGNSCNVLRLEQGVADGGLEVVMMVGDKLTLLETLDAAHEKGLLVMVNMGDSTSCAGSPSRLIQTKETVNIVKDHPALFGYKVQDEPLQNLTPEEHLLAGYVAIRELDPNHVIYSDDGVEGDFPILARYTDYMESDSYTGNAKSASHIVNTITIAEAASRGRKPVGILQKAYEVAPADVYFPTFEEFRHYGYQCLIAGGGGWGYHAVGKNGTGVPLIEREVWKEIVEWEKRGEQDLMYDCMVKGKYPLLGAYKDNEVIWHLYAVEGKLYAFVVNTVGGVGVTEGSKKVDIPLTDASFGKALGEFTATLKWDAKEATVSGKDTLSVEIPSFSVQVWEIELANPVDFSGHKITKYNDIDQAPWAYQAVAKLQQAKVLNEDIDLRYEPQAQITRGDYAMFLVRALGLTADATENFADVKPYAEYADALAIGKALGIFNGRGDNLYDPEKPATRAELMALTARALRLVGVEANGDAASLDAFSDKAAVPEWAAQDVAAMVSMGIVKGNADGTVNPNGNTTRAEAAVIVNRVMER